LCLELIVCNMGLKPSASAETFMSTSCGFQKISWKAQTDSKGGAFGRLKEGDMEEGDSKFLPRYELCLLSFQEKVNARRGVSDKLEIISIYNTISF